MRPPGDLIGSLTHSTCLLHMPVSTAAQPVLGHRQQCMTSPAPFLSGSMTVVLVFKLLSPCRAGSCKHHTFVAVVSCIFA